MPTGFGRAELEPGLPSRGIGVHAKADQMGHVRLDVAPQFFGQVVLEAGPPRERAQERTKRGDHV